MKPSLNLTLSCVLSVAFSLLPSSAMAQSVTEVSAPYAVVGKPAWFVVSGTGFPTTESSQLGMKFVIPPPHRCDDAQRTAPVTSLRYEFSCVFASPAERASVIVFNRTRQGVQRLAKVELEVLAADPKVTGVRIYSNAATSNQLRVICLEPSACLTMQEPWQTENEIWVEVIGDNLPRSLRLEWPRCQSAQIVNEPYDRSTKLYRCRTATTTAATDEQSKQIKLLSSSRIEDARLLFSSRVQP